MKYLPRRVTPDYERGAVGQQRYGWPKKRPEYVDSVVGIENVLIAALESLDFAFLLRECFDHANSGDRVGQNIDHLRPGSTGVCKSMAQPNPNPLSHPSDERKRQERDDSEIYVDPKQHDRRHDDHEDVGAKIEQVHRQERAD